MGQREIQLNFATDVRDLIYISPNTVLDDTNQGPGGVAAAYIRGVGVSEVEKNFDPAVGVIVVVETYRDIRMGVLAFFSG